MDDPEDDGNVGYVVVLNPASSGDPRYDGLDAHDVSVTNRDNDGPGDDTPGITVIPTSGLVTTEDGAVAWFSVVLNTQPTADVTINLSSSDTTEGNVSTMQLTFTPGNWSTAQVVAVSGLDDQLVDGDIAYHIVLGSATSLDADYQGIDAADVSVTNRDNDKKKPPKEPLLPPPGPGPGGTSNTVGSFDPNDKFGPAGFGAVGFVRADGSLDYTVRFENKSDAGAPAREIVVTDLLDNDLDLDSFELNEIAFANRVISIPAGQSFYDSTVTFQANGVDLLAVIHAQLDRASRTLTLRLQAIDPATGWFSEDPLLGLLYPENGTGRGQGWVSYRVRPLDGLPTGTVVTNRARIVFDYNEPIDTPLVLNTLDAGAPTSAVTALPPSMLGTSLTLNWSGQDDAGGSGVAGYTIYVSVDGGPYFAIITDTTATSAVINVEPGHTFAFYSLATDNVGHVEAAPASPDATIVNIRPPYVQQVIVNDGSSQRSRVTSLTVAFSEIVNFPNGAAGVFQLVRTGPGAPTGQVSLSIDFSQSTATQTIARLTFSGPLTEFGSLVDGVYTLTVFGQQVVNGAGLILDGDGNGIHGGDHVRKLHRLFGDTDGDRDVDTADFLQFRSAFGLAAGSPGFRPELDLEGDNDIDSADFLRFRGNLGTSFPSSLVDQLFVNDGAPQRSRVTSLRIVFGELVNFPNGTSAAFQVVRTGPGGPTGPVTVFIDLSQSTATQTVAILTFSGPLTENGSLIDGQFAVTILGDQVLNSSGQQLDGDDDGQPGGNFVRTFHRLFGDSDGDADVDALDFLSFRLTSGLTISDFEFNPAFDFDTDGDADALDFLRFRTRFGTSVP